MRCDNRADCEQFGEIWRLTAQPTQADSIATILEWATGDTRNCSSGRANGTSPARVRLSRNGLERSPRHAEVTVHEAQIRSLLGKTMTKPIRFSGPKIKNAEKAAQEQGASYELKRDATLVISLEAHVVPTTAPAEGEAA